MRILLVLLIAACTEHGRSPNDGRPSSDGGDPAVCEASFQAALDRSCVSSTDCTLVDHDDCCGIVRLGIAARAASGFAAIEAELQTCRPCPPLGCNHADQAEDGRVPQMGQAIEAICRVGSCTSVVQ